MAFRNNMNYAKNLGRKWCKFFNLKTVLHKTSCCWWWKHWTSLSFEWKLKQTTRSSSYLTWRNSTLRSECKIKVNNKDISNRCEMYSKLIKTPEEHHWRRSSDFLFNFEQISHLFLVLRWIYKELIHDN